MSDWTPTTDDIKSIWRSRYDSEHHWAVGEELRGYEAEFDRWLEQVKAEAWDECCYETMGQGTVQVPANPYRQELDA